MVFSITVTFVKQWNCKQCYCFFGLAWMFGIPCWKTVLVINSRLSPSWKTRRHHNQISTARRSLLQETKWLLLTAQLYPITAFVNQMTVVQSFQKTFFKQERPNSLTAGYLQISASIKPLDCHGEFMKRETRGCFPFSVESTVLKAPIANPMCGT